MKKLIFTASLIMLSYVLLLTPLTEAKVAQSHDDLDFSPLVRSSVKLSGEPWAAVAFWKTLRTNTTYTLELTTYDYKEWIFFDGQVFLRYGDSDWQELDLINQTTRNEWPNIITTTRYAVPKQVVDLIAGSQTGDRFQLRLAFQNKIYVEYQVPETMLREWREVIRTYLTGVR